MPIIKFQTSPKSNGNTGSCAAAISYFTKEDKERDSSELGYGFFNSEKTGIKHEDAKKIIEHKVWKKALRNDESKFFHVVISFSQEELQSKTDSQLIELVQNNFAETYLRAGQRDEISPLELSWCAKLENTRKYKGDDEKVLKNEKKSGQLKEGDNRHIHILVSRKTLNDKKISPLSNHFRGGKGKGAVKSGFDQDRFKADFEYIFDEETKHSRASEDSVSTKLRQYRPDLFESKMSPLDFAMRNLDKEITKLNVKKQAFIPKAKTLYFAIKLSFIGVIKRYGMRLNKQKNQSPHPLKAKEEKPLIAVEPKEVIDFSYFTKKQQELLKKLANNEGDRTLLMQEMKELAIQSKEFKNKKSNNNNPGTPGINNNNEFNM